MTSVDFVVEKGAVRGSKLIHPLSIPQGIKKNRTYSNFFVRGFADTAGGLYMYNHCIKGNVYVTIGTALLTIVRNLLLK